MVSSPQNSTGLTMPTNSVTGNKNTRGMVIYKGRKYLNK